MLPHAAHLHSFTNCLMRQIDWFAKLPHAANRFSHRTASCGESVQFLKANSILPNNENRDLNYLIVLGSYPVSYPVPFI